MEDEGVRSARIVRGALAGQPMLSLLLCAALAPGPPAGPGPEELPEPVEITAPIAVPSPAPEAPATPTHVAPPDRWPFMKSLQGVWAGDVLDGNRMSISGWTEMSFTASTDRAGNLPLGFNYRANDFSVQQNWLRIERSVAPSGTTEPTFGFRSDWILPGIDYRFTLARGIFNDQLTAHNGLPATYGIDPLQFYAEAYVPSIAEGMDIKLGRFVSPICAETIDAPSNLLVSHSYASNYDPFTHTGILTTTKLTPTWSVQAGLVLGSDVFIDPADEPTFVGGVKWAEAGQRNSVQLTAIIGSGRFNVEQNFNNVNVFDLVYTHTFNPRLVYTLDAMFGYETNVPGIGAADWAAAVNYLSYTLTPRVSAAARLGFFEDAQGQRTGFPGLYSVLTTGLAFRPRKAVIIRPELRYDYNDESRPFENKHGLFTATGDVILRW
jgi:hypothetical protein